MKRFVPMLAIFLILGLPVSGEMEKAKIKEYQWQVDDLLTSDRVQEYAISPSGRWLVWSVAKWNLKEQTRFQHVFLTDLKKKKPDLQLIRGEDQINSLQWLPDEKAISFKTSRKPKEGKENNLWRLDLAGGEPYPVTDFDKGVMQAAWIDSDHLLFTARETETLLETRLTEKKDTAEVVEDEENRTMVRLFLYDMKEKKVTRLTRNLKPIMGFSLSEDKRWMIYGLSMSLLYEQDEEVRPKFFLLNLKSGEPREIFADPALKAVGRFFWSLDNRGFYAAVAYSTHPTYTMAAVEKVYWYDLRTQAAREINLDWPRYGGPLSVSKDGFIMALPDGVYYNYAGYRHQGESWQRLWLKGENLKNVSDLQVAANGNTAVYEYSTASQPSRYYLAELRVDELKKIREVMDIQSPLFKRPLAKTEIISWKGALNEPIEGILYYPYAYEAGKKYPLIVMIHGGPYGADMDSFEDRVGYAAHLYCERGAFILKPNYHGSSNYGLAFGESIAGHYYEYEIPDIEAGVDKLIAEGKADPDRLGLIGWSNGALLGIALTVHTTRYKAASMGAGDVNWTSDYGNCSFGVAFDNYYLGGAPWEKVQTYIEKSPLFRMAQVTTPTLIFHGTIDRQVPYEQGWEYYRALQRIGKAPVRFISFPDEAHGLRKLAHNRRKLEEEIAWFEKYLFRNHVEPNKALKKGSPLELLAGVLAIARSDGLYGLRQGSTLIPETVEFKGMRVGRFEVTRAQWAAFDPNYKYDKGTDNWPVTNISFAQAQKYVRWLSEQAKQIFHLPDESEAKEIYGSRGGNTFDYWAGYTLSPDDYRLLQAEISKFGEQPVLLKPVGSFAPQGYPPVYDLDGNAAEWVALKNGEGKACGASADLPQEEKSELQPNSKYIGLRVICDGGKKE